MNATTKLLISPFLMNTLSNVTGLQRITRILILGMLLIKSHAIHLIKSIPLNAVIAALLGMSTTIQNLKTEEANNNVGIGAKEDVPCKFEHVETYRFQERC